MLSKLRILDFLRINRVDIRLLTLWRPVYDCMDAGGRVTQEQLPRDGTNLVQAYKWNVGTCRSGVKERNSKEEEYPIQSTGADCLVVVMKVL